MHNVLGIAAAAAAISLMAQPVSAQTWEVDKAHTEITFEVRHFFTPTSGKFDEFDIDLVYDADDLGASSVSAVIPIASIDTNNESRDEHLNSPDFFSAGEFPRMSFESTSIRRVSDDQLIATGNLTIRDVTREVEMPITILGVKEIPAEMQEMMGGAKRVASFEAVLDIDRNDFGVGTGQWAADAVVGKTVSIRLLVEAHDRSE